jgi:hypothetical protein
VSSAKAVASFTPKPTITTLFPRRSGGWQFGAVEPPAHMEVFVKHGEIDAALLDPAGWF